DGDEEDNPEIPHVFAANDWSLAGIFDWISQAEMDELGLNRAEAVAYVESPQDRLFWRLQGGEWTELPLTQATHRSVRAPWGEVLTVFRHRYHIFPAGSVA